MQNKKIKYRHPTFNEGLSVFHLIKSCPPLDLNSIYYYYIICRDFSDTCVVAESDQGMVGFISAYRKPQEPSSLFVWQVAVAKTARGHHIASNMLEWLVEQPSCNNIRVLETTISPSNQASQSLFRRFAEKHQAICQTSTFLDISQFGDRAHEAEILFRITPL